MQTVLGCDILEQPVQMLLLAASILLRSSCSGFHLLVQQMRKAAGLEGKMTYDPCISRQTPIYMKRPDVLKAIHADTHPNPNWPRDRPGWRYGKGYAVYTVAQLKIGPAATAMHVNVHAELLLQLQVNSAAFPCPA